MGSIISECPICGSSRIIHETGDFICHDGFQVAGIEYVRCEECGEKFYDKEASRMIDNALRSAGRLKKKKLAA